MRRFLKEITVSKTEETYSLNHLVPLDPRGLVEKKLGAEGSETTFTAFATKEENGFDGYMDAVSTWGSKWGACEVYVQNVEDSHLFITYESAWSPCSPLIQKISQQFPELSFGVYFTEESNAFAGYEVIHNGETVEESTIDTQDTPPELRKKYEKANEAEDESAWEEYWEAESEWNHYILDRISADCEDVLSQFAKYLATQKRRIKQGKEIDEFIPT